MIFCHDLNVEENAEEKDGKKQKPGAASNGSGVRDAHKRSSQHVGWSIL
jgi:hypothetical protein